MKSTAVAAFSFSLASLFSTAVQGQFVPASNPDITLTSGVTCATPSVSADMLVNATGILKAMYYSDGTNSYIAVVDDVAGSVLIPLSPGSYEGDVVLADDIMTPGAQYIVAVAYSNGGQAYIDTYELTGFGTPGGLSYSLLSTTSLGSVGGFPHIDMFADNNMLINGLPAMHQYVVTWIDNVPGGGLQINAQYGEIDNPASPINTTVVDATSGNYIYADVAASKNIVTGDLTAYFSIHKYNGSSELRYAAWDCNSSSSPTVTTLMSNDTYLPHIEAMGLYDPAVSSDPWVIAAPKINPTDVRLYMFDITNATGFDCTPIAPYFDMGSMASAVAAGSGDPTGVGVYANDNYTVGWYAQAFGCISRAVDYTTGSISTAYPGYYQINQAVTPGCQKQSLAITSTSNLGKGLLSVWYGGGRVFYKQNSDITTFKPAPLGIDDNIAGSKLFTVSPNPACNMVQVRSNENATLKRIEIYNLLGQLVYSEDLSKVNVASIAIDQLPDGLYNMTIYSEDSKTIKKIQVLK